MSRVRNRGKTANRQTAKNAKENDRKLTTEDADDTEKPPDSWLFLRALCGARFSSPCFYRADGLGMPSTSITSAASSYLPKAGMM